MAQFLPRSVAPRTLVKVLFYFSQKITVQHLDSIDSGTLRACCNLIDSGTLRACCNLIRSYLCHWLIISNSQLLGGEGIESSLRPKTSQKKGSAQMFDYINAGYMEFLSHQEAFP